METYRFWQDLFDTYQSLPDWLKALWLLALLLLAALFVSLIKAIITRPRLPPSPRPLPRALPEGELIYSVRRLENGRLLLYRHGAQEEDAFARLAPLVREEAEERRLTPP